MKTITKSLPEDLKWLEYLQRSFELPNSFTHHRMKHRGGKQWPSQDMTVLPDIITRILLPYKKLLSPKDDCLPIFHLYNRTGKKVVLFKFKIHCPYSFSPRKKKNKIKKINHLSLQAPQIHIISWRMDITIEKTKGQL